MSKNDIINLTGTLSLVERRDGFWLYDKTRGMNISMKAKTQQDAFVEGLGYYQRRLTEVEAAHRELSDKVEAFVGQFKDEDDI